MLHLVFQSPVDPAIFGRMDSGDVAVFLESSVLPLRRNSILAEPLIQQLNRNRLCVLSDDLKIRGIASDELVKGIEVIDYSELIELTVVNPIIHSWT